MTALGGVAVAGVAFGIAVLGEGVNLNAGASLLLICFAAVAGFGVVLLSRFHPGAGSPVTAVADEHTPVQEQTPVQERTPVPEQSPFQEQDRTRDLRG